MKKLRVAALLALALFFVGSASAQQFSVKDECGNREENLFSLYSASGGHIGAPGYFDNQVCGSGIEQVELAESCDTGLTRIMTIADEEGGHGSIYSNYPVSVCASFSAELNSSCDSDRQIVSFASQDNSHVGDPSAYSNVLCSGQTSVDTVTLSMELDSSTTYIDGETASPGSYSSDSLDYPYIVSGEPAGLVSYGDTVSVNYNDSGSRTEYSITQTGDGSFLIPNTEGGQRSIDRRESAVQSRNFLQQLSPSFAYRIPDNPLVRVIYDPSVNITGFEREQSGSLDLYVRHRTDDIPEPVIEIGTE